MKQIRLILFLLLLSTASLAQSTWRVTAVDPMYNSTYSTLTLRITAETDQMFASQFVMMYHKQYMQGDTLIVRPYYNELSVGSGVPQKQTIVTDLYVGAYSPSGFFKHLCVTPYGAMGLDTNMYPPTQNPPNYCFDMKQVVSVPSLNNVDDFASVYPNPATNSITVNGEVHDLRIYNLSGALLQQEHLPTGAISIATLPAGVYVVRLQKGGEVTYQRLVKE